MYKFYIFYPKERTPLRFERKGFEAHVKKAKELLGDKCIACTYEYGGHEGMKQVFDAMYTATVCFTFETVYDAFEALDPVFVEIADAIVDFTDIKPQLHFAQTFDV